MCYRPLSQPSNSIREEETNICVEEDGVTGQKSLGFFEKSDASFLEVLLDVACLLDEEARGRAGHNQFAALVSPF